MVKLKAEEVQFKLKPRVISSAEKFFHGRIMVVFILVISIALISGIPSVIKEDGIVIGIFLIFVVILAFFYAVALDALGTIKKSTYIVYNQKVDEFFIYTFEKYKYLFFINKSLSTYEEEIKYSKDSIVSFNIIKTSEYMDGLGRIKEENINLYNILTRNILVSSDLSKDYYVKKGYYLSYILVEIEEKEKIIPLALYEFEQDAIEELKAVVQLLNASDKAFLGSEIKKELIHM